MFEVEAKVVLMAPGALRDRLRRVGAVPGVTVRQEDHYVQHPCRDLAATDEALRARCEEDAAGGAAGAAWSVTYKGPRLEADVKARREHQFRVDGDPRPLLAALGFEEVARVVKTREAWRLGDVSVALDDVEGLGWFAEVEVVSRDAPAAGEVVEQALRALALQGADRVEQSYLELLTS